MGNAKCEMGNRKSAPRDNLTKSDDYEAYETWPSYSSESYNELYVSLAIMMTVPPVVVVVVIIVVVVVIVACA